MITPVNVIGKLLTGQYAGWFVKVQDSAGDFLILLNEKPDFRSRKGFDYWAAFEDLDQFFLESGWHIVWSLEQDA